jgi:hypothetical protein
VSRGREKEERKKRERRDKEILFKIQRFSQKPNTQT